MRGGSLNGPIMWTNIVTPQETVSTFSTMVESTMNGTRATQAPTTATPIRARLSDSAANDSSVARAPATIAFTMWKVLSGRMPAAITSQALIRIDTERESISNLLREGESKFDSSRDVEGFG